ncbi:MAG TPA: hypothetical protein VMH02_08935 [Verrucomicrobiae bacterium]|nr:hypothetical protein [Verrucomicrobiae bacterium]
MTFTPTSASIVYSGNVNGSGNPEIDLYAPLGGGTGSQFTFTATQAGYSGITETTSGCSNIAAVTQSGSTFTVTAVASPVAGTCSLTLHGFNGSTQAVIITYTSFGPVLE